MCFPQHRHCVATAKLMGCATFTPSPIPRALAHPFSRPGTVPKPHVRTFACRALMLCTCPCMCCPTQRYYAVEGLRGYDIICSLPMAASLRSRPRPTPCSRTNRTQPMRPYACAYAHVQCVHALNLPMHVLPHTTACCCYWMTTLSLHLTRRWLKQARHVHSCTKNILDTYT